MRRWLLPLALSTLLAGPALAQSQPTAARSALTGTAFPDKPFALQADPLDGQFMDAAANDLGRRCGSPESYGWVFPKGDQSRLSKIVDQTMAAIEKNGFKVAQAKTPSVEVPGVVVITGDKAKQRLIMAWIPAKDQVKLLICDGSQAAKK